MENPTQLTTAEQTTLLASLNAALLVAAKERSVDHGLFFQILALRDNPETALKELRDLLASIEATPALEFFNHARQCAIGYQNDVSFRFLVGWLISRGQQVGAEQAITDLTHYLESETIEVSSVLAVKGFNVESKIKLGVYELDAWNDVPLTDTKWRIVARSLHGNAAPTAVLVRRHEIRPIHVRPWDQQPSEILQSLEPALDILRCVTAVAGAGFQLLHFWLEPEEWAPWAVSPSMFGVDSTTMSWPIDLGEAAATQLCSSVTHMQALDESSRTRLRVPLDRLNRSYLAGLNSVNKAIELGVAIESLYAPTKLSDSISFAVRTRAARFLGGSLEERRATVKTLKDVYGLRSCAVHSGRFDADGTAKKWQDDNLVRTTLEKGQSIVGKSLVKVIQMGEPDWTSFDISEQN